MLKFINNLPIILYFRTTKYEIKELDEEKNKYNNDPLVKIYFGLGGYKWMECIDRHIHKYGYKAFDEGLGTASKEPGFMNSMINAFKFIGNNLKQPTTYEFYLNLHKIACSHFDNTKTNTVIGPKEIGITRHICNNKLYRGFNCNNDNNIIRELHNEKLITTYIPKGLISLIKNNGLIEKQLCKINNNKLYWNYLTKDEIKLLMNNNIKEYYNTINTTNDEETILWAIARFHWKMELLHPTIDGNTRTNTLILNKHLTETGYHPAILDYPMIDFLECSKISLLSHLENGLKEWSKMAVKCGFKCTCKYCNRK